MSEAHPQQPVSAAGKEGFRFLPLAAVTIGFILIWTLFHVVVESPNAISGDTAEAYVWGHQFEWGYWKHPPFWAWIAGLWFDVFPHDIWGEAALAAVNGAIGLLGAWALIGCFLAGRERITATLLLLLTPFYTLLDFKYNANCIFLSLWPWTAYFFVRSIERMNLPDALAFGAMAGLDFLSKYYAFILLATCAVAALLHPNRRAYFKSVLPYASAGVTAAFVAPHIYWLLRNDFLPFAYFQEESGRDWLFTTRQIAELILQYSAYIALPFLLLAVFGGTTPQQWRATFRHRLGDARFRFLLALSAMPMLLTLLAATLLGLVISENTLNSIFPLASVVLMQAMGVTGMRRLERVATIGACVLTGVALLVAPVAARSGPHNLAFSRKVASTAEILWKKHARGPVTTITGSEPFAERTAFYAPDHPADFIHFSTTDAPWVSLAKLPSHGFMAICATDDASCVHHAEMLAPQRFFEQKVSPPKPAKPRSDDAKPLLVIVVPPKQTKAEQAAGHPDQADRPVR
jgi:hypothetical protein